MGLSGFRSVAFLFSLKATMQKRSVSKTHGRPFFVFRVFYQYILSYKIRKTINKKTINRILLVYAQIPYTVVFLIPRSFGTGRGSKHVGGVDFYNLDFGVNILFHCLYRLYCLLITEFLYAAADSQYFANLATRLISSALSLYAASVVTNV